MKTNKRQVCVCVFFCVREKWVECVKSWRKLGWSNEYGGMSNGGQKMYAMTVISPGGWETDESAGRHEKSFARFC